MSAFDPVLSVVVPVYFNEESIPLVVAELMALEKQIGRIEVVLVDDGSLDQSYLKMKELREKYPENLTLVKLTRNFGSMAAIMAGMSVAEGRCVAMISADLQDPPDMLVEMHQIWQQGTKVVLAVRADRAEKGPRRWAASFYYWLLRLFALRDYPTGGFDYFLIDRSVAEEVLKTGEKNTNLMSLIFWLGFPCKLLPYRREARIHGRSCWTLAKRIKLFVDSFAAFSYAPIRIMSLVGFLVALLSFSYALFVAAFRIFYGQPVAGFSTLACLVASLSGLQMLMLGVLGEYLWRTLDEARRRPNFVVEHLIQRKP